MMRKLFCITGVITLLVSGCNIDELPRTNPYDRESGIVPEYTLKMSRVEILKESVTEDGVLQPFETMHLRVYVRNDGPDVAGLGNVFFSSTVDRFDVSVKPEQAIDDYEGTTTVEGYIDPNTELWLDSGFEVPGMTGENYSVKLYCFSAAPSGLEVRVDVVMNDPYDQVFTDEFTFNVQ